MPVRELLERMDSRELSEWMAYCRIEAERMEGKPIDGTDEVTNKLKDAFSVYQSEAYVEGIKKGKK